MNEPTEWFDTEIPVTRLDPLDLGTTAPWPSSGACQSEVRTPTEWSQAKGLIIRDPDGWRSAAAPSWWTPITEAEFDERAGLSTVQWVNR